MRIVRFPAHSKASFGVAQTRRASSPAPARQHHVAIIAALPHRVDVSIGKVAPKGKYASFNLADIAKGFVEPFGLIAAGEFCDTRNAVTAIVDAVTLGFEGTMRSREFGSLRLTIEALPTANPRRRPKDPQTVSERVGDVLEVLSMGAAVYLSIAVEPPTGGAKFDAADITRRAGLLKTALEAVLA